MSHDAAPTPSSPATPPAPATAADQYEAERRRKREELRELGHNPYGRRVANVISLADARAQHNPAAAEGSEPRVTIAGRVVLKRDMGKLSFLTLRDDTGDLQVGLQKNRLTDAEWEVRNRIDLGDQIAVTGGVGTTKTGEATVWAESLQMASKSLLVPPSKFHGLEDVEQRYRQRYVDFWANPPAMELAHKRIRIVERMRKYLRDKGFVEVETPMLQVMHGGAAARPFVTHHNALDIDLFLRIAPELYLKRLLVGGFRKVFEINRNFRNEGISPRHNPEFTMLEAYEAFGNWETMAELVEDMVCTIAEEVLGGLVLEHKNAQGTVTRTIDLRGDESKPRGQRWRRVRMADLVEERTGWKFDKRPMQEAAPELMERLLARGTGSVSGPEHQTPAAPEHGQAAHATAGAATLEVAASPASHLEKLSPAEQLVEVYEKLVEPTLIDPCFVTHVPSVIIPLARPAEDDPFFADVYELAINGQEISPGYTELNDPDVQEAQFRRQVGDEAEKQLVDEDFLTALKYGMPPAGGMGLGVDRLVMMLTGAESIRDVLLFPLMRPRG